MIVFHNFTSTLCTNQLIQKDQATVIVWHCVTLQNGYRPLSHIVIVLKIVVLETLLNPSSISDSSFKHQHDNKLTPFNFKQPMNFTLKTNSPWFECPCWGDFWRKAWWGIPPSRKDVPKTSKWLLDNDEAGNQTHSRLHGGCQADR